MRNQIIVEQKERIRMHNISCRSSLIRFVGQKQTYHCQTRISSRSSGGGRPNILLYYYYYTQELFYDLLDVDDTAHTIQYEQGHIVVYGDCATSASAVTNFLAYRNGQVCVCIRVLYHTTISAKLYRDSYYYCRGKNLWFVYTTISGVHVVRDFEKNIKVLPVAYAGSYRTREARDSKNKRSKEKISSLKKQYNFFNSYSICMKM